MSRGVIINRIEPGKGLEVLVPTERDGCKEIIESGRFPGVGTDTRLMSNANATMDPYPSDMPEHQKKEYAAKAKRAGVNPHGMMYMSGLAHEPGDPNAYINPEHFRSDSKRIIDQQGMGAEGAVNRTARIESSPNSEYTPAEDIVLERVEDIAEERGIDECTQAEFVDLKTEAVKTLKHKEE